jgi:hypothetical protein
MIFTSSFAKIWPLIKCYYMLLIHTQACIYFLIYNESSLKWLRLMKSWKQFSGRREIGKFVRREDKCTSDRENSPGDIHAALVAFAQSGSEPHARWLFSAISAPLHWNAHQSTVLIKESVCSENKRWAVNPGPNRTIYVRMRVNETLGVEYFVLNISASIDINAFFSSIRFLHCVRAYWGGIRLYFFLYVRNKTYSTWSSNLIKTFIYNTVRQRCNELFLHSFTFTLDTTRFAPKWPSSGVLLCWNCYTALILSIRHICDCTLRDSNVTIVV